jgi:hypothetical protein
VNTLALTSKQLGDVVNYGLMVLAGVYVTLVGFRVIRVSKRREAEDAWHAKWGGMFKVLGPVLIGIGAVLMLVSAARG